MSAIPEEIKLLLVVLIMLFAQPLVELSDEQEQINRMASSSGNHESRSTTPRANESGRNREARERSHRQERLPSFTFASTN